MHGSRPVSGQPSTPETYLMRCENPETSNSNAESENKMRIPAIALAAILSSSCATRTVYVCPTLPEPVRPAFPALAPGDLECVTDATADTLAERELRLVEYAEDAVTVIQAHNRACRGTDGP